MSLRSVTIAVAAMTAAFVATTTLMALTGRMRRRTPNHIQRLFGMRYTVATQQTMDGDFVSYIPQLECNALVGRGFTAEESVNDLAEIVDEFMEYLSVEGLLKVPIPNEDFDQWQDRVLGINA